MKKTPSSFWHKFRQVFLCLMMLMMFERAVMPAPAAALIVITDPTQLVPSLLDWVKTKAGWVMEKMKLTSFITTLMDTYNKYAEVFSTWYNKIFDSSALEVTSQQTITERKIKQYLAIAEKRTEDMVAAEQAKVIARHTPPKNPQLCRSILVHELVSTTTDFAREVSRMIVEGISNRSRYAGSSEPLEVMKDLINLCGGDLKFGSRLDGHEGCYDSKSTALRGTDGRRFEDAYLGEIDGSQVYEMPMIQSEQYTDPVTNKTVVVRYPAAADGDNQKFWLAAFNGLYYKVGHRPIPLSGAGLRSPVGLTQRVMFNHCAANQNALIKQCADKLAFYTRPNRKDPLLDDMRAQQKTMCLAAKKSIDMERFGNCDEGLSAYEAHKIQEEWCRATDHTMAMIAGGASSDEARQASNVCEEMAMTNANMIARLTYNCTAAIRAMSELDECWDAVSALGQGGRGASPVSSTAKPVPHSSFQKINAVGR